MVGEGLLGLGSGTYLFREADSTNTMFIVEPKLI